MRENKCIDCGIERHRSAKTGRCHQCKLANDKIVNRARTIKMLTDLGYDIISDFENSSHAMITVKRLSCGHLTTSRVNNIITQKCKCQICGPIERMKKCLAGYMRDHGRDYDLKKWVDYRTLCRRLTNRTYKQNKNILNPNDLPRSMKDNHIDHKVPLIVCFKEGIAPEKAASLTNIQFVTAKSNLSKNKHEYDKKILRKLLINK